MKEAALERSTRTGRSTPGAGTAEPSVIGGGTRVRGRIEGHGPLRLEGEVVGDVAISGAMDVGEGARLEGNLQADALDVAGTVQGDVRARGAIRIRSTAEVEGELAGSEISIEPGARVSVRLNADFELDL